MPTVPVIKEATNDRCGYLQDSCAACGYDFGQVVFPSLSLVCSAVKWDVDTIQL